MYRTSGHPLMYEPQAWLAMDTLSHESRRNFCLHPRYAPRLQRGSASDSFHHKITSITFPRKYTHAIRRRLFLPQPTRQPATRIRTPRIITDPTLLQRIDYLPTQTRKTNTKKILANTSLRKTCSPPTSKTHTKHRIKFRFRSTPPTPSIPPITHSLARPSRPNFPARGRASAHPKTCPHSLQRTPSEKQTASQIHRASSQISLALRDQSPRLLFFFRFF